MKSGSVLVTIMVVAGLVTAYFTWQGMTQANAEARLEEQTKITAEQAAAQQRAAEQAAADSSAVQPQP